jgi:DNA-binding transcriptional LysR family regulator
VSLFHRHARGLILTEQGDLLFRTAHDVFMQLQAARAKLTDSRERPSGDLKVTPHQVSASTGSFRGSANSPRFIPTSAFR